MGMFYENMLLIDCNWYYCFISLTFPLVSCLYINLWHHGFM